VFFRVERRHRPAVDSREIEHVVEYQTQSDFRPLGTGRDSPERDFGEAAE
jgi:hypothetical protein